MLTDLFFQTNMFELVTNKTMSRSSWLTSFFDSSWVGSIFCGSGQVSHLWFGFGKFPLKMSIFSIFFPSDQKKSLQVGSKSTWVKGGSASYLLQVKSKLGSGQGPSLCLSSMASSFLKQKMPQYSGKSTL